LQEIKEKLYRGWCNERHSLAVLPLK
jgi:hypothetical protein